MIRRATWLGAGAVLGILGYRRIGRLARSIRPQRLALPGHRPAAGVADLRERGAAAVIRPARRRPRGGAGEFLSDVREGMADYMNRHSARSGNTLVGQQVRVGRHAIPGSDNPKDGR